MSRPRRLLSVSHSYAVGLNRRLAHEMARAGGSRWEVTAVAPRYFHGGRDLRPVRLAASADEPCAVAAVDARLTRFVHGFYYGSALRRLMRDGPPRGGFDLVHLWEEPYVLAGAQVAYWTPPHVPLVVATFQNIPKRYPPPFRWMERYAMSRSAGWIAFGQTVAQAVGSRDGYSTRPTRIISPGVDIEHFRPDADARRTTRRELGFDDAGAPVVGFVGRFAQEKGVRFLTQVLDRVGAPWRALLVGAGPMESHLRRWVASHGDRARLRSDVVHDEVWRFLNAIDVLCVPSRTTPRWREQFGRAIIEGFACGVPVIGSDSGEIPFVIGDAGIVCPEGDLGAWIGALRGLLNSPDRRRELGQRGLARARERYAWPVVARAHLEFFEQILEGGAPR